MKEKFKKISEEQVIQFAIYGLEHKIKIYIDLLSCFEEHNVNGEWVEHHIKELKVLINQFKELCGFENRRFKKLGLLSVVEFNKLRIKEFETAKKNLLKEWKRRNG